MRRSTGVLIAILIGGVVVSDLKSQSPDRLALAHRLLDAMGIETAPGREMFPVFVPDSTTPEGQAAAMDALREFSNKYFKPDVLRPTLARAWAEEFSDSELRAMIAFYESDVGRKMTAKAPAIAKRGRVLIDEIFERHREEFERSVLKLPPSKPETDDGLW